MLLDEFIMCMALCNTVVVSDLNTATFALKGAATEAVSAPLRYCRSTDSADWAVDTILRHTRVCYPPRVLQR